MVASSPYFCKKASALKRRSRKILSGDSPFGTLTMISTINLYFQEVGVAGSCTDTVTRFKEDVAVEEARVMLGDEIEPVEMVTPLSEDVRPAVPGPAASVDERGEERGRTTMLTRLSGNGVADVDDAAVWFVFPSGVSFVGVKNDLSVGEGVFNIFWTGGVGVPIIGGDPSSVSILLSFWQEELRRELDSEISDDFLAFLEESDITSKMLLLAVGLE